MANGNSAVATVNPVVSTSKPEANNERETLIVNIECVKMLAKAFKMQDDYENESKFALVFIEHAIGIATKALASTTIARWDGVVNKYSKAHPGVDRNTCIVEVQSSKKNRDLKKLADVAIEAKKSL